MSIDSSLPAVEPTAAEPSLTLRHGAKALVRTPSSSRVLLVREQHADGRDFWTLPGGGVEPGEGPGEALRRELEEELGSDGLIGDPVDAFVYAHQSTPWTVSVYAVFDCALTSSTDPTRAEGVFEAQWVDPAAPPARTLPAVRYLLARRTDSPQN